MLTKERIPLTEQELKMLVPEETIWWIEKQAKGRWTVLEKIFNAGNAFSSSLGRQSDAVIKARDILGITLPLAKRLSSTDFIAEFEKIKKEKWPYLSQNIRSQTLGQSARNPIPIQDDPAPKKR